ncbi:hypothetical protein [Longimicrobium sp.]|uniref:hypothetical protein n=1 Tax=Longimicrobium sp. TaxID=2029185 RepID=UPI002BAC0FDB|nr:hypothetical protein [Longimicrobium sp.]HSU12718.1 hypothetical protein [Longimicrobium sp.]
MTIRTTSILLAASLVALATACASAAGKAAYAPEPVRGCRYTGPVSGHKLVSRFSDTTATAGTAKEALDTAAAVLRREGYTVAERAPGEAVVTQAAPAGRARPLGVRVDAIGAQQIAFCALWGLRFAALEDLQPEGPTDPAPREAVALYGRIREAVLARR